MLNRCLYLVDFERQFCPYSGTRYGTLPTDMNDCRAEVNWNTGQPTVGSTCKQPIVTVRVIKPCDSSYPFRMFMTA